LIIELKKGACPFFAISFEEFGRDVKTGSRRTGKNILESGVDLDSVNNSVNNNGKLNKREKMN
jgi:hypothetical protein